jgi:uncharacterized membrane protein
MIVIPVAIAALAGGAYWVAKKRKPGGMTPERRKVYDAALTTLKDPVKLRKLADTFEKEGLKTEANVLRKRAALRELPPETKKARKETFRKALQSKNKDAVQKTADEFRKQGAVGAAGELDKHAAGIQDSPKESRRHAKDEIDPVETVTKVVTFNND